MSELTPPDDPISRFVTDTPGDDVRRQVMGAVHRELRARRRDRWFTRIAGTLIVLSLVFSTAVEFRESARLARWFPAPANQEWPSAKARLAASPPPESRMDDLSPSSPDPVGDYLATVYPDPPWLLGRPDRSAVRERPIQGTL